MGDDAPIADPLGAWITAQGGPDRVTSFEVRDLLLRLLDDPARQEVIIALKARGVPRHTVLAGALLAGAARYMDPDYFNTTAWRVYRILSIVSSVASGYHGYKRHEAGAHPIAWGVGWFVLGGIFPVITPTIALAEGFARPLPSSRA